MTSGRAQFDALRSLASGAISGSYANVGSALEYPANCFRISNNTDGDLIFSHDGGITDHFFLAAGTYVVYDIQANRRKVNQDCYQLPVGSQFAVKQVSAPTQDSVYIEVMR